MKALIALLKLVWPLTVFIVLYAFILVESSKAERSHHNSGQSLILAGRVDPSISVRVENSRFSDREILIQNQSNSESGYSIFLSSDNDPEKMDLSDAGKPLLAEFSQKTAPLTSKPVEIFSSSGIKNGDLTSKSSEMKLKLKGHSRPITLTVISN